jgi:DNA-binding transcriptional LysR family regulator
MMAPESECEALGRYQSSGYGLEVIDSRQLEMFQQVIDSGSFSAAARVLRCSQPAISQQMRALERAMGGPLFIRAGRTLQLTEAGKVLARHSSTILGDLAVARLQVQAVSALDLGAVRICGFPSANASLIPQTAALLRSSAPHMRLELHEQEPPEALAMLRRAECDVAVAFTYPGADHDPDAVTGMTRIPLLEEPLMLLVPVRHPLVDRARLDSGEKHRPVRLADLAGQAWIAGCPTCRVTFMSTCQAAGFAPDIVFSTDDNMALQSLVASGLGVALVPSMVMAFLRHPEVVALPVEPVTWRHIAAYTWPDLARVEAVRKTLSALVSVARRLG